MALFISDVTREEEEVKRVIEGVWCPTDASCRWRKGNTQRTKLLYYDVIPVLVGSSDPGCPLLFTREYENVVS